MPNVRHYCHILRKISLIYIIAQISYRKIKNESNYGQKMWLNTVDSIASPGKLLKHISEVFTRSTQSQQNMEQ